MRREQVISTFLKMIHQTGYRGTTMRRVAEELDCDVANLYNYLSSKQQVLEDHLMALSADFHQQIDQILTSQLSSVDKLAVLVHHYVTMSYQRPYAMSLLVNEWRHLEDKIQRKFLQERRQYEQKVRLLIEEGMQKHEFKALNVEVATHLVLSATRWLFTYYTARGKKPNPLDLEAQILEFIQTGICQSQ